MPRFKPLVAAVALCLIAATPAAKPLAMDPVNPTCPAVMNWSDAPKMQFTVRDTDFGKVLLAEGAIDAGMAIRLKETLRRNRDVEEVWLRSPGGDARVGNEAGLMLRKMEKGIITRIPAGWACFSACNFVFMGGSARIVEPGGQFAVHMFTHVGDREAVRGSIARNADRAVDMIGDIEQDSALLASDDNDFLIRMGVSRKLLTEVMYQQKAVAARGKPQSTRRCLTQAEAFKYNVANARP